MPSSTRPCILPISWSDQHRATAEPTPPTVRWTHQEALHWLPVNSRRLVITARLPLKRLTSRIRSATSADPFPNPPAVPATPVGRAKGPKSAPTASVAPSGRVGGCLSHHWQQWSAIGAEPWVVSILRDGYRIPFRDLPPPSQGPRCRSRRPAGFRARSRSPGRDQDHDGERGSRNSFRPRS